MEENAKFHQPQALFMSESIDQITAALSAFQGSITQPSLNKEVQVTTKTGGKYKFKYADLSECVKAAAPKLNENGLAVSQLICNGCLITLLSHKSGQWLKSELYLAPERISDYQSLGSAITYLKRYSYCAILGIVADADDDANAACGNTAVEVDRRAKVNAVAFTGEQLKTAIAEVAACQNMDEVNALWQRYQKAIPAMCAKGTEFFNAVASKSRELHPMA